MTREFLLFTASGKAHFMPTCAAVLVAATLASIPSPWGFMQYQSKELLTVMVPIAGTVLALALPAAQLAQSVVENFLSRVAELSKKPVEDLVAVFSRLAVQRRKDLASMYCVIVYSLCSFLFGAAGLLGMGSDLRVEGIISARDWIACASIGFLTASVLWFLPVVRSSFNTHLIDKILEMLQEATEAPAGVPPREHTVAASAAQDHGKAPQEHAHAPRQGGSADQGARAKPPHPRGT
jgi:hypothetical protein